MQTEQTVRDEQIEHKLGHFTHTVALLSKYPSIGMHLEELGFKTLKSRVTLQLEQAP